MKFSPDFFKTEDRNGFEVSSMMKRAWAAQMEVLAVVAEICDRHQLHFFADWGTLLGAMRHKGFIPWDDDIDICLRRKEYNELIRILPKELPHGFVMAGMYAQSERLQNAAYVPQLRVIADETLWNFNLYMQRFHGFPYQRVGIDIFPLDNMPKNSEIAVAHRDLIRQGIVLLRDWDMLEQSGQLQKWLRRYEEWCHVQIPERKDIKNWMWRLIDTLCTLYEDDDTEEITTWTVWMNSPKLYKVKAEWYNQVSYVPFEQMQIPVPGKWDEVLTAQFGEWEKPSLEKGGHDYPFYGGMEEELMKQIRAVGFKGDVEEFCDKVSKGELWV